MKRRNVKLRKLPIFGDFFVNNALILALRQLKTGRKQQELKEASLNFSKLFSDPKNNKFQENTNVFVRIGMIFFCSSVFWTFIDCFTKESSQ